jgi:transposase
MPKLNDLSRSLVTLEQDATLIAVIEMGQSSWLVAGIVPGVERQPLKKLAVDESALLKLLNRWREEAQQAGRSNCFTSQSRMPACAGGAISNGPPP